MEESAEDIAPPEAAWIERARQGDEAAFGELMQLHYETVFRTVFTIVRNEHDARDLAQEVWIKVWGQIGNYRGDSKFTTWLHPIASRRALDHLRKRKRWFDRFLPFQREDDDGETTTYLEPVDEDPVAPEQIEADERRTHFETVLNTLPPKQRAVLALREIQGLSYDEIAVAVGCRRGTVMSRLFNARRLLAQKLRETPCE
ncbi:RNA polymerase sigma factor [Synoicihabitans lomoniglobus]|uniref:Sigma-70 family RNA polymerase sigma factor n=1 Tax=Synoicihabitans lomoniglobus TaxID=2909285 RepID=A0AAF0CNZ8_9BACT|nr:sigma-70 family RNA polymerase sigma factor [Opitutaceae bacterium LMO-M01]WED65331.1 sigma-70 family RNA polymerase sigma factor [Opitutaceae bacterium LMO-M01]